MNEKNVEALTAALEAANAEFQHDKEFPVLDCNYVEAFAAMLASRGVLVPGALTDEQLDDVAGATYGAYLSQIPEHDKGRAELERIAKGEPNG